MVQTPSKSDVLPTQGSPEPNEEAREKDKESAVAAAVESNAGDNDVLSQEAAAIRAEIEEEKAKPIWEPNSSPAKQERSKKSASPARSKPKQLDAGGSHSVARATALAPHGLYSFSSTSRVTQGAALGCPSPDRGSSIRRGFESKLLSGSKVAARSKKASSRSVKRAPDSPRNQVKLASTFFALTPREQTFTPMPAASSFVSGESGKKNSVAVVSPTTKSYERLKELQRAFEEQLKLDASRASLLAQIAEAESDGNFDEVSAKGSQRV